MSTAAFKLIPVVMLVLGFHAPGAFAQAVPSAQMARLAPSVAERLHADALASFRQGRFPEAYGRFIKLANAGHAPAAELALWMYLHSHAVFNQDWDSSQEQLTAWAELAGQTAPAIVARSYPSVSSPLASLTR
jgi:hypothetical protein